jgi:hypothetical protein
MVFVTVLSATSTGRRSWRRIWNFPRLGDRVVRRSFTARGLSASKIVYCRTTGVERVSRDVRREKKEDDEQGRILFLMEVVRQLSCAGLCPASFRPLRGSIRTYEAIVPFQGNLVFLRQVVEKVCYEGAWSLSVTICERFVVDVCDLLCSAFVGMAMTILRFLDCSRMASKIYALYTMNLSPRRSVDFDSDLILALGKDKRRSVPNSDRCAKQPSLHLACRLDQVLPPNQPALM